MNSRSKPWWKSRILWLNAAAAAGVAIEASLHLLQDDLRAPVYLALAGALAALNFILRTITTAPLTSPRPRRRHGE